jgi:hypothetical protein
VIYQAQNPGPGLRPERVLQQRRSLKQDISSPYKGREQALSSIRDSCQV